MWKVDLNSDLGESFGTYKLGMDSEVIKNVSSVNLACGYHAGDPMVMERTVKMCKDAGVAIGAHPGYPDLMGFGRRKMKLTFDEAKAYIKYQLGALTAFAQSNGMKIQHLKAHGAMGNTSAKDVELAKAICTAVEEVDPSIIILSFAHCEVIKIAHEMGLRYANEVFADRAYNDDLTLVARGTPGAMISDSEFAVKRIVKMVKEGKVTTINGKEMEITVQSICMHGDSMGAVEITRSMREALEAEGVQITNLENFI